jgi:hypothetical protein
MYSRSLLKFDMMSMHGQSRERAGLIKMRLGSTMFPIEPTLSPAPS